MKVECIDFTEPGDTNCFTPYKKYLVLELYVTPDGSKYTVIPNFGTPILCSINKFKVIDSRIPRNWIVKDNGNESILLSPYKWIDDSLWRYSFWEDYYDDDEEAIRVFQEEVDKMMAESDL